MKGLDNIGNTCCFNTLIQCLGHSSRFRELLLAPNSPVAKRRKDATELVTHELRKVIDALWVAQQPVRPQAFVACLGKVFQKGEQHDICELAVYVCDAIVEECGNKKFQAVFTDNHTIHQTLAKLAREGAEAWNRFNPQGLSDWNWTLQGLQVAQVSCKRCQYACHNHEPFTQLTLPLPSGAPPQENSVKLTDCLSALFEPETLQDWRCDRCRECQPAQRAMRFWNMPDVLLVSLKRFSYCPNKSKMQKNRTPVTITDELVFSTHAVIAAKSAILYDLAAIGIHHGSCHFGHYTAVGKLPDGKWMHYDDDTVAPADIDRVLNDNRDAYLLVYERRRGT